MKLFWLFCLVSVVASAQAAGQIEFVAAQHREVAQIYSTDGLVEAVRQSTVSAQIGGRVKEISFDVGDRVSKGQILLRIDEREAAQALAGSQAQVMQAQADLQNAKAVHERATRLFEQKFISQAALDRAQADYKVALAQAAASEAVAGQARLTHGYATVAAPYSGIVAARLVEVGEMVMPGTPLMTAFEPGELRVVVSVPQYELAKFGLNPEAMVEVSSRERWIKAASVTVLPIADSRTHSTQLRVHLPFEEKNIYPGMFVRAHFVMGKTSRLVIPASAVLRRSEVVAAYVADGKGGVKLRQIRLGGMPIDGMVEVLSGLSQGEQVALDPVKAGIISADGGQK